MIVALRFLSCVFVALNIRPNQASQPYLRISYDNNQDLEKKTDIYRDLNKYVDVKDGRKHIQENIDRKPILRGGFENDNNLDQLENSENDAHNNRNHQIYGTLTQGDNSYEEINSNSIEGRYDSRIEDDQNVKAVQNEHNNKILALILLNSDSNQRSPKNLDHELNSELKGYNRKYRNIANLLSHLQDYTLRKRSSSIWKKCSKQAAKTCKKACKDVVNSNCPGGKDRDCKKSVKKRLKMECKSRCKDRFSFDD